MKLVKKTRKKLTAEVLCLLLSVVMMFTIVGCDKSENNNTDNNTTVATESTEESKSNVLGEGKTSFNFVVVQADGAETTFEVKTDKETVGDALVEVGMIQGEKSEYGLYVKTVNGITADYDTSKTYWAFYIDGEYATTGVDSTKVKAGATYTFKVEKG